MSETFTGRYKFIGMPDRIFPNLVPGKIYTLTIETQWDGFLGWVYGVRKPTIISPIRCPYSSFYTFRDNWEAVL